MLGWSARKAADREEVTVDRFQSGAGDREGRGVGTILRPGTYDTHFIVRDIAIFPTISMPSRPVSSAIAPANAGLPLIVVACLTHRVGIGRASDDSVATAGGSAQRRQSASVSAPGTL